MNITDKMVRLSVGIENYRDIICNIPQALAKVVIKLPALNAPGSKNAFMKDRNKRYSGP